MPQFQIQDTTLDAPLKVDSAGLLIQSSPRPYRIEFIRDQSVAAMIEAAIAEARHPLVLIDQRVRDLYARDCPSLAACPHLAVEATEDFKTLDGVLALVALMEKHGATRTSMLFVIGGGIIQDVGAFAGAMYKRGIPWTYIPTTLLAQGDSCAGGKTGLNLGKTKNLLALFSAPRRVLIHTGFLPTLAQADILSGLGESFRLCVTGGAPFLDRFEQLLPAALGGDGNALTDLIEMSLAVKRAVIEHDEFELDIRRAMNLGHSIGHAFEALTDHAIPHGIGVTVGILVENAISTSRDLLSEAEYQRLVAIGRQLIPANVADTLRGMALDQVVDILRRDKKTEGTVLKLVVVARIGQIRFIDLALDDSTIPVLKAALARVLAAL